MFVDGEWKLQCHCGKRPYKPSLRDSGTFRCNTLINHARECEFKGTPAAVDDEVSSRVQGVDVSPAESSTLCDISCAIVDRIKLKHWLTKLGYGDKFNVVPLEGEIRVECSNSQCGVTYKVSTRSSNGAIRCNSLKSHTCKIVTVADVGDEGEGVCADGEDEDAEQVDRRYDAACTLAAQYENEGIVLFPVKGELYIRCDFCVKGKSALQLPVYGRGSLAKQVGLHVGGKLHIKTKSSNQKNLHAFYSREQSFLAKAASFVDSYAAKQCFGCRIGPQDFYKELKDNIPAVRYDNLRFVPVYSIPPVASLDTVDGGKPKLVAYGHFRSKSCRGPSKSDYIWYDHSCGSCTNLPLERSFIRECKRKKSEKHRRKERRGRRWKLSRKALRLWMKTFQPLQLGPRSPHQQLPQDRGDSARAHTKGGEPERNT